jgi:DNA-binding CsgD family transcriptional regulator
MQYQDLAEFFVYAREVGEDLDALLQLLCIRTLGEFNIEGMVFLKLNQNGHLQPVSFFGFDTSEIELRDKEFLLHEPTPISEAIRKQKLIFVENLHQIPDKQPAVSSLKLPERFQSMVAFPIQVGARVMGSIMAVSTKKKISSPQLIEILEAIGTTIGSLLIPSTSNNGNHGNHVAGNSRSQITKMENGESGELTERQLLILQMISEGRTNADIADLLGYSESLVRQETIRIYSKLNCTGRAEAASFYRNSLAPSAKGA